MKILSSLGIGLPSSSTGEMPTMRKVEPMKSELGMSQERVSAMADMALKSVPASDRHDPGDTGWCFGPGEWMNNREWIDVGARLQEIPEFPWSSGIWSEPCPFRKGCLIRDTHIAFLGIDSLRPSGRDPLTIRAWFTLYPDLFPSTFPDNWWWPRQQFALQETCAFRWYLMPRSCVMSSSRALTYEAQLANLPKNYEVPSTVEVVSMLVLHKKMTGEYPPSRAQWGRCRNIVPTRHLQSRALISTATGILRFDFIGDEYQGFKELIGTYASRCLP